MASHRSERAHRRMDGRQLIHSENSPRVARLGHQICRIASTRVINAPASEHL